MAKLTKIAYFGSLRGTIDFGNLLLLEKTSKNLLLEQNMQLNFFVGIDNKQGVQFSSKFSQIGRW